MLPKRLPEIILNQALVGRHKFTMTNEQGFLRVYYWMQKPKLNEIGQYLSHRAAIQQNTMMLRLPKTYVDQLGNKVIYSPFNRTESILNNSTCQEIIISPEGRDVLHNYPGLLKKIANPTELPLTEIGHEDDREARVFRIQDTPLVVKYEFATVHLNGRQRVAFTSQRDGMRMVQSLIKSKAYKGLQVVQPMIATVDMSISKVVEGAYMLVQESFDKEEIGKMTNNRDKDYLNEIVDYDRNKIIIDKFVFWYQLFSTLATSGLSRWLKDNIHNKDVFPF